MGFADGINPGAPLGVQERNISLVIMMTEKSFRTNQTLNGLTAALTITLTYVHALPTINEYSSAG
jgi:hypothetical protein